ncbi:ATP-binding cassette domain-containing protein, partial [Acinetobacter baumannii]|uniref:ATP-binding cassette domain-containing protein n=1 Tax=Acinetobacter baumannii TaxID=470 RepID=UPI000A6D9D35
MAGLKLQAVSKSWDGKTQVIQPLTLDVADGELIVMAGPSRSGKSRLLRMVAGLGRGTSGYIWTNRTPGTDMERNDRRTAMVVQTLGPSAHKRVAGNVDLGPAMRGRGKGSI